MVAIGLLYCPTSFTGASIRGNVRAVPRTRGDGLQALFLLCFNDLALQEPHGSHAAT